MFASLFLWCILIRVPWFFAVCVMSISKSKKRQQIFDNIQQYNVDWIDIQHNKLQKWKTKWNNKTGNKKKFALFDWKCVFDLRQRVFLIALIKWVLVPPRIIKYTYTQIDYVFSHNHNGSFYVDFVVGLIFGRSLCLFVLASSFSLFVGFLALCFLLFCIYLFDATRNC